MTSVSSSSPATLNVKQTTAHKVPSPYQSISAKNCYTKSPNKASRNSTSQRSEENYRDGQKSIGLYEVRCSSAGAIEGLHPSHRKDELSKITPLEPAFQPVPKTRRVSTVKTKSLVGRSQRNVVHGADSKTIKFLLNLTTKIYFETLKYEIDRIKENGRRIQDQTSSHAASIMVLNGRAEDFENQMEHLRVQNSRLLFETRRDLFHCRSVCNLLLKNLIKVQEPEISARQQQSSKRVDSDARKEFKSQPTKSIHRNNELKKKVSSKPPSVRSLYSGSGQTRALKRQKSKHSRRSTKKYTSLSSMSSMVTGSDLATHIVPTSAASRMSTKLSTETIILDQCLPTKAEAETKKRTKGLMFGCCGGRSKVSKKQKR